MRRIGYMMSCVLCLFIMGCNGETMLNASVDNSQDLLPAEEIVVTKAPEGTDHSFEPVSEDISDDDDNDNDALGYKQVINRVLNEYGFEPFDWKNTVDWKEDADVLIKMAEDNKGRYKAYGIISREEGSYGIVLIDTVDLTEFNVNYVYEKWFYTGGSDGEPELYWDKSRLYFTYPVPMGTGYIMKTAEIDCGYDSGHMEFRKEE